jgi:hypothetical protein
MFPGSLFPGSLFPGSLFPGSGPSSPSRPPPSTGLVGLYPGSLFPGSLFPGSLFPGTSAAAVIAPPAPPILFDVEFAAWLAGLFPGVGFFPLKLPQEAIGYPLATYTLVDGDSLLVLSGPDGQAWRDYQVDCYSPDYVQALTLDRSIAKALQGLSGPMGRVHVQEANRHRPSSFYATPPDSSDDGIYRFMSEYTIWYVEP